VRPRSFLRPFTLRSTLLALAFASLAALHAAPLSRRTEIDFFRDVPSRNLKGLAARSDGRLVAGPTLTDLAGDSPADLLWSLAPGANPNTWLVGTGPDGKLFELTVDAAKSSYTARELVKLDDPHLYALARLRDGSILAGTSPHGALVLIRDGLQVARVSLPVDSIFDILLPHNQGDALIATGSPARIYTVNLSAFARAGVQPDKVTDPATLASYGIRLFGEVRDRNLRRLARLTDGRIVAGSAPKGNIYAFDPSLAPAADGPMFAPVILQENRDAEVTDFLPTDDGGFYATLTFSSTAGETRMTPTRPGRDLPDPLAALSSSTERFGGRSTLVWFPPNAFPETVASRNNTAFYRAVRHDHFILLSGGEQGEVLGYDPTQRLSLTFAGSVSSQLNAFAPIPDSPGRFLLLRNNAPGLAVLDFTSQSAREAETRRLDLGVPSQIGALRFQRLRDLPESRLSVDLRTSNGSDEVEGWSSWIALHQNDGGWSAADRRGRHVRLRLRLPADTPATAQIDKAHLYFLPQNRRPQLQEFRLLSPNFGVIPAPEPMPQTTVSLSQIIQGAPKEDDSKLKSSFLGSQVVPTPGAQVVLWTVADPDNDNLVSTFSIRRDGDDTWTDIVVNSPDPFVQFDTSHLADGLYFTRLVVSETDPRREADRLTTTFDTDDLLIDRTAPEILEASAKRDSNRLVVTVRGRDALSIVYGIEAILNNNTRAETEQPVDGIRDSREETFTIELPLARATNATSVEVILYDQVGNTAARRLKIE